MAKVVADVTVKGYVVCIPISEHQAYDLVVLNKNGKAIRLQAKYAQLRKNGTVEVRSRRYWADKKGIHIGRYQCTEFDYYAVYCPEKEVVLYVPNTPNVPYCIRFEKTKNQQTSCIHWANNYLSLDRESSETIRHTPEMVKT